MKHLRLFWEFFKISLFVVGGGYAIIVVADDVFGRKRKWLAEGELLEHLPVFQMVPGLIAGNTAIYTGLKTLGRTGAVAALLGVALPSFVIFLAVSLGYSRLPVDNPYVAGALGGLRAALTGVIFGTLIRGWRKSVVGLYGWIALAVATALLVAFHVNVVVVLLCAMAAGLVWTFAGGRLPPADSRGAGLELAPLGRGARAVSALVLVGAAVGVTLAGGAAYWTFAKFGLLGFGGGYVLIPMYMQAFVGDAAPYLHLPLEEFSNLMALTQGTPGPVSVNAATFFGYRLLAPHGLCAGICGAAVATAALLLPSFFLLTAALQGLEKWKRSRFVQGILFGVRPATSALILHAGIVFAGLSLCKGGFQPFAAVLALLSGTLLLTRKLSIMATIFLCAALGAGQIFAARLFL